MQPSVANASRIVDLLKKVRSFLTQWIAEQTFTHLENIRKFELEAVIDLFPEGAKVLEIGAGSGWQAAVLQSKGFDVSAIDLGDSTYKELQSFPVADYDGKRIPFEDSVFDVVFSSNVLEHIPHVREFQAEIHRVLKPQGGRAVHLLPSSSWRFWSSVTHVLRRLTLPKPHGEHAGNSLSEVYYFSRRWWADVFEKTGWNVLVTRSNGLFYTGSSIMDARFSIASRHGLSRILGGACNVFVLEAPRT
jgi:2-polyprenyl-3-methyl-5-hydroxy-6-metoxy-1,4-benzoquinol methylase